MAMFTLSGENMIYSVGALLSSVALCVTAIPFVYTFAFKIGALDIPTDSRRMHITPVPRNGGLAIFLSFLLTTLCFCDITPTLKNLWVGGFILTIIGTLDDIFKLNAWIKLAFQSISAFIAVRGGCVIESIDLFGFGFETDVFSIPVTILFILLITNAHNLIDGMDLLATAVSVIEALAIFLILFVGGSEKSISLAALAGSILGFMKYNHHPAKIFMGDCGSLFVGFCLAVFSVDAFEPLGISFPVITVCAIFLIPISDTFYAIFRRILRGKSPFASDRSHLHHRLFDKIRDVSLTVSLICVFSIFGVTAALMLTFSELCRPAFIVLLSLSLFIIRCHRFRKDEKKSLSGIYK